MNAGIACQGFICRTAKNAAEMHIAFAGFILFINPLSTRPLHNHSSKRGAKIETESRDAQTRSEYQAFHSNPIVRVGVSHYFIDLLFTMNQPDTDVRIFFRKMMSQMLGAIYRTMLPTGTTESHHQVSESPS